MESGIKVARAWGYRVKGVAPDRATIILGRYELVLHDSTLSGLLDLVDGIGILQAKSQLGTVPSDADAGRYLRGIIRNAYDQAEISLAAESYLRNRLYLRDLSLRGLVAQDEELRQSCSTAQQQLWALIDRALAAPTTIDYHFWAMRAAETISGATAAERVSLYRSAAKRIAASYRAERFRKQSLLTRLARVLSE